MTAETSILCPQDFSPCSERALARAAELARILEQPIELMHVYQLPYLPEPPLGMGAALTLEGREMLRMEAEARLTAQREQLEKQGIRASIRVVEGSPAALIAKRAQTPETSLVVMGTHGRKALGRVLLGSVAERVLRTSKVPVMTVRLAD